LELKTSLLRTAIYTYIVYIFNLTDIPIFYRAQAALTGYGDNSP